MTLRLGWAVIALCAGSAAQAQGFSGAEASAEVLGYTGDFSLGETRYELGAEFAATRALGFGAAYSRHGMRTGEGAVSNWTLRAIWSGSGKSFGAFAAWDSMDDAETSLMGIEAAAAMGQIQLNGGLGLARGDLADGVLVDADARYGLSEGLAATARATVLGGDTGGSRIGVGAEYQLGQGPTLFGEFGRAATDGSSEAYVSLGASIGIGPQKGTTFGARSIFDALPGR